MTPSQDMVLGADYLTATRQEKSLPAFGDRKLTFASLADVCNAYEEKLLGLHDWIWVRFNGEVDDEDDSREPVSSDVLSDGSRIEQWKFRRDRFDEHGELISRFLLTTTGRVLMNRTIIDAVAAR